MHCVACLGTLLPGGGDRVSSGLPRWFPTASLAPRELRTGATVVPTLAKRWRDPSSWEGARASMIAVGLYPGVDYYIVEAVEGARHTRRILTFAARHAPSLCPQTAAETGPRSSCSPPTRWCPSWSASGRSKFASTTRRAGCLPPPITRSPPASPLGSLRPWGRSRSPSRSGPFSGDRAQHASPRTRGVRSARGRPAHGRVVLAAA